MYKTVVVFRVKNYFYLCAYTKNNIRLNSRISLNLPCLTEEASRSNEASRLPYNYFEKGCRKKCARESPKR